MSYSMWYVLLWVPAMCIVTLRASCGAVYCNQSCLFVCGWVPLSIVTVILKMNLGQPVSTEAKDDGGGGDNWTTGATSRAKLQSNHHHQQTNIHFLQARCPSCRPTNSVKALRWKIITFHGLAYPKLTWGLPTLSPTTNSSWLPWGGLPCLSSALWCQM